MPTTGPLSGKYGEARMGASSDVDELLSWELDYGYKTEEYASRHGGGATETAEGVARGTGTIMVNVNVASSMSSIAGTGQLIQLNLYNQRTGPTLQASGMARIGNYGLKADRSGAVQQIKIPFTCHGFWTLGQ